MTYKNKCLKALNSEDFFIKSRDNQLFKIYKKEPIDGKWFDIHIQQISRPNYSLSQIKTKNLNLLHSMTLG